MTPALEVRGVSRTFGGPAAPVTALDGIDLTLFNGSFTAVMGPSGSGKSTLLNSVVGLEAVDSGTIRIGGREITGMNERQLAEFRRAHVGMVFQDFQLMPYLTAAENVGLPLRLAGRRVDDERVRELLEAVGLGGRADHMPSELSGGQQQRVSIARALVTGPDVILADEPTGSLDSQSAVEILDLLVSCVNNLDATVVMVTHDPAAAARAEAVVFLVDGQIDGSLVNPTADIVASRLAHLGRRVA
ncbi:ABC transporter ATP-binding protein [Aeromicrobium sp. 9AM]|uniref:ABC transporter ATP-binding protein n=1 Tax=Aeromicrobium sp. 9AM TaxID=2653126 RepID=UPI00135A6ACC|nr:ABC transporter ATP-binding protein [Aeromicrobium sp. 9AM]